jgi:hypothetical protein
LVRTIAGLGAKFAEVTGVDDMCSVPPATIVVANPLMIRSAALAIVCRPDEQKRFTVWAGTSSGSPARWAASLATFMPWVPSGMAQPRITSSTSAGSRPEARRSASAMAAPAMSSGLDVRSAPFGARPTAVRAPATSTASFMLPLFSVQTVGGHSAARCAGFPRRCSVQPARGSGPPP